MVMALFNSPPLVRVGPGYLAEVAGLAGPTALDDLLFVNVLDPATSAVISSGSAVCAGFTSVAVVLGVFATDTHGPLAHQSQVQSGDTVSVELRHYTAALSLVESVTVTGLVWDPVNGVGSLLSNLHAGASSGGALGSILAAVRRVYP